MIGYAYLDLDGNLVYKPREYIEERNLHFWSQNAHMILRKFKFNTEDRFDMLNFFKKISDLKVSPDTVMKFCQQINFDLKTLKPPEQDNKNANKI